MNDRLALLHVNRERRRGDAIELFGAHFPEHRQVRDERLGLDLDLPCAHARAIRGQWIMRQDALPAQGDI
ncbi:hypothetical protein D3C83_135860 [compost metagenome]